MTKIKNNIDQIINDEIIKVEDALSEYGPVTTTNTKTTTKDEIRDYQKTPEVNKLLEKYGDKSKAIRALHSQGYKNGQIADMLRIRFQHVRNVLNQK
jgi:hypothetical protein